MYPGDCQALECLASRLDWDDTTHVLTGDSMGGQTSLAGVERAGKRTKVTVMTARVFSGADAGARSKGRLMVCLQWTNRPVRDDNS